MTIAAIDGRRAVFARSHAYAFTQGPVCEQFWTACDVIKAYSLVAQRGHADTSLLLQQLNVRLPRSRARPSALMGIPFACGLKDESSRTLNLEHGKMHRSGESLPNSGLVISPSKVR